MYFFQINQLKTFFSASGLFISLFAASLVLTDNFIQLKTHQYHLSTSIFLIAFFLGFLTESLGLILLAFLLPLCPTLNTQIQAYLSIFWPSQPETAFDLISGIFLGLTLKILISQNQKPGYSKFRALLPPWQIGILVTFIGFSSVLAITRNFWQSSSIITMDGFIFNLMRFRSLNWTEDFRPLKDFISFGLAGGTFVIVQAISLSKDDKLKIIFRSVMLGLLASFIVALLQAQSGAGITPSQFYRKDFLGIAAYGFQPDLHAFAGYMLLGAIGLWGYLIYSTTKVEKLFCLLTIFLSLAGLLLSKSRSTLLIAIFFTLYIFIIYFIKNIINKNYPKKYIILLTVIFISLYLLLFSVYKIPDWIFVTYEDLININVSNHILVNELFALRFSKFLSALHMLWDYPFAGIGQGNFLRDSIFYNHLNDSNLSLDYGGENAHNYFLQTIAENGLIGGLLFFIAVFIPIFRIKNFFNPAVLAIIALFLGNIYAHSFLIRDNLFLATIFLSLIYLELNQNEKITVGVDQAIKGYRPAWVIKAMAVLIFMGLLSLEIYHSFFKYPFTYGKLCQMKTSASPDGWTSGLVEIALPKNAKGLSIPFTMDRIDRQSRDIAINLAIASASGAIISTKNINLSRVNSPEIAELNIAMPSDATIAQLDGNKVIITVSSCLTPINLGIKPDLRRLGIQIKTPIFLF